MGRRPKEPRRDSYGAWMHYLRKQAGLSQEEVQDRLSVMLGRDIGNSTVSQWERRGNFANRDTIPALAEILGVSIEVLLRVHRTKDNRYLPVVPSPEEEERLQDIGKRKPWNWFPDPNAPKGYDAQDPFKKGKNLRGVAPVKIIKPEPPGKKPVKPETSGESTERNQPPPPRPPVPPKASEGDDPANEPPSA